MKDEIKKDPSVEVKKIPFLTARQLWCNTFIAFVFLLPVISGEGGYHLWILTILVIVQVFVLDATQNLHNHLIELKDKRLMTQEKVIFALSKISISKEEKTQTY